ncbi:hypothetical protein VTK26DRAFT_2368 [Humicola hyalothermophila]
MPGRVTVVRWRVKTMKRRCRRLWTELQLQSRKRTIAEKTRDADAESRMVHQTKMQRSIKRCEEERKEENSSKTAGALEEVLRCPPPLSSGCWAVEPTKPRRKEPRGAPCSYMYVLLYRAGTERTGEVPSVTPSIRDGSSSAKLGGKAAAARKVKHVGHLEVLFIILDDDWGQL